MGGWSVCGAFAPLTKGLNSTLVDPAAAAMNWYYRLVAVDLQSGLQSQRTSPVVLHATV